MPRNLDYLTQGIFNGFGNRKKPGRLSILVDLNYEPIILAVPRNQEHIDFAAKLYPGLDKQTLSKLVPSHIDFKKDENNIEQVVGVFTGNSGLEIRYKSRHRRRDLELAHKKVWEFIKQGEFFGEVKVGKIQENNIDYRYSI